MLQRRRVLKHFCFYKLMVGVKRMLLKTSLFPFDEQACCSLSVRRNSSSKEAQKLATKKRLLFLLKFQH